jgi:hypothetical protein
LPLLLVALATAGAFALFASNAARADDPPPTTVPTPTLPTPVPAPVTPPPPAKTPPPRRSKPPRRSTPPAKKTTTKPTTSHVATPTPTPTYTQPTVVSPPTHALPKQSHRSAKKVRRKAKPASVGSKPAASAKPKAQGTLGASVGFLLQPKAKSARNSPNLSPFIVLGLALAVACFLIALVPATAVPWRPVAVFISQRQFDLTLAGLALLAATLWVYTMKGI